MATVTETVKESLLGTTREPQLSQQAKVTFDQNATKDEETGELYMTEEQFVDAIAPVGEDYVSLSKAPARFGLYRSYSKSGMLPVQRTDRINHHSTRSNGTPTQYYSASPTDGNLVE